MQSQPQVYEGTWEEVVQHGPEFAGRRVRLTILSDVKTSDVATVPETQARNGHLYFGMFQGDQDVTEEDFKLAEWRGEDVEI